MPVPNEGQAAHTVSQRIRMIKRVPPELIPLGIVVGVALGAAGYSITRKFIVDKNLRLNRQAGSSKHAESDH